MLKNNLWSKNL